MAETTPTPTTFTDATRQAPAARGIRKVLDHVVIDEPNSTRMFLHVWQGSALDQAVGAAGYDRIAIASGFCGTIPLGYHCPSGCVIACTTGADAQGDIADPVYPSFRWL